MKDHLLEFQEFRGEAITFDSLDLTFYENFVDFLSFEYVQKRRKERIVGLKTNTVGKTIKQLRTFLRNRIRKRIIPHKCFSSIAYISSLIRDFFINI
jgi:hypothetical protein